MVKGFDFIKLVPILNKCHASIKNTLSLHQFPYIISQISREAKHITTRSYQGLLALRTTSIVIPPLRKHSTLSSLFIPARTTSILLRIHRIPLLAMQICKNSRISAGARATTLVEGWKGRGGGVAVLGGVGGSRVLHIVRFGFETRYGKV